jgi:hypothetical protein
MNERFKIEFPCQILNTQSLSELKLFIKEQLTIIDQSIGKVPMIRISTLKLYLLNGSSFLEEDCIRDCNHIKNIMIQKKHFGQQLN